MAGRGPAPKFPEERRNRAPKARGEWIEIPASSGARVPVLPKRAAGSGAWSTATRAAWSAWWGDGASTTWTPADRDAVVQCARLFEEAVRDPRPTRWGEVRHWMDGLGLTPKGKRDLRLRIVEPDDQATSSGPAPVGVTRLADRRSRLTS